MRACVRACPAFSATDDFSEEREEIENVFKERERVEVGREGGMKKKRLVASFPALEKTSPLFFILFSLLPFLVRLRRSLWHPSIALRPRTILHRKTFSLTGPCCDWKQLAVPSEAGDEDPSLPQLPSLVVRRPSFSAISLPPCNFSPTNRLPQRAPLFICVSVRVQRTPRSSCTAP